ncbi:hypothetical protein VEx25_B0416 [Vibrio antiquarius]|uniref:Uncharacterized protein n=2 Tax=Vibrio antiquarius (strain Ex25) TaxID=150340 RepID=A0ACA6QVC8_VIBAE|nr:hypothetical protein VEA_001571 [Vibrio antiquarius]EDN56937.1 hypothetical protein VEx25_B0416 [Vibrio antiquarius]
MNSNHQDRASDWFEESVLTEFVEEKSNNMVTTETRLKWWLLLC